MSRLLVRPPWRGGFQGGLDPPCPDPPGPGGLSRGGNFLSRMGELLNTQKNVHFFGSGAPPGGPPPYGGSQRDPPNPPFLYISFLLRTFWGAILGGPRRGPGGPRGGPRGGPGGGGPRAPAPGARAPGGGPRGGPPGGVPGGVGGGTLGGTPEGGGPRGGDPPSLNCGASRRGCILCEAKHGSGHSIVVECVVWLHGVPQRRHASR